MRSALISLPADRQALFTLRAAFRDLRTEHPELWAQLLRVHGQTSVVAFVEALEEEHFGVVADAVPVPIARKERVVGIRR